MVALNIVQLHAVRLLHCVALAAACCVRVVWCGRGQRAVGCSEGKAEQANAQVIWSQDDIDRYCEGAQREGKLGKRSRSVNEVLIFVSKNPNR